MNRVSKNCGSKLLSSKQAVESIHFEALELHPLAGREGAHQSGCRIGHPEYAQSHCKAKKGSEYIHKFNPSPIFTDMLHNVKPSSVFSGMQVNKG